MIRTLLAALGAMLMVAGSASAQSYGRYSAYSRGNDTFISVSGKEFRIVEPPAGITFDFSAAMSDMGAGFEDAGCQLSFGMWKPDRPNRKIAMRGFASRSNEVIDWLSWTPAEHSTVYVQHPNVLTGINAFVPKRIIRELESFGYDGTTSLFIDNEVVFLIEERYEDCRYKVYVTDYIPIGNRFNLNNGLMDDGMTKLKFGLDVLDLYFKVKRYY